MYSSKAKSRNPWVIVGIMLAGAFMALLDVTIVNVALPDIQAGLHASDSVLQWIVSAYALAFGLVLIPSGRLGDRFGHNVTFLVGLGIFTLASLGCGFSQSDWQIMGARAVEGFGAGIFIPSIRSAIRILFSDRERPRAFSALGTVIGASTALGPLLGGILIRYAGWRWVFIVNVPIGLVLVPLAWWMLPSIRLERRGRGFDPVGVGLLTAALFLLLFPLVEGQSAGWPLWTWLVLGGAVIGFIGLWHWEKCQERRGVEPIVPPRLLSIRSFGAGTLLATFYFGAFTSIFFVFSLLWQQGLRRSALATGLTILPFALCSMLGSSLSHKLAARLGRRVLHLGCMLLAVGLGGYLLALYAAGPSVNEWLLIGPFAVAGVGNGFFIAPNQNFILASVERREAGTASGILGAAQRIGSAVGIAGVGSVFFTTLSLGGRGGAEAFVRSAATATLFNIGLVAIAFLLVFTLPAESSSEGIGQSSIS